MTNNVEIYTGGAAFPISPQINPQGGTIGIGTGGMFLRDYFAAQVLNGLYANDTDIGGLDTQEVRRARRSYYQADVMLMIRDIDLGAD